MIDKDVHKYRNFIGGEWVESETSEWEPNINPANFDDTLGLAPRSTVDEVNAAIDAAAQASEAWKGTTALERGGRLATAARLLRDYHEDLSQQITLEEGKSIREARLEVSKSVQVFEYMAGAGYRLGGITRPSAFAKNLAYTFREPLGTVAVITPWNFPVSIPAWKIAPALVAGNTVIFKPASYVPGSSELFIKVLDEAGMPPGVINLIYGAGREIGDTLLNHKEVRGVSFTGSDTIGSQIYAISGQRGIPAQCEMGGKNPCIIMEDADLELAVRALIGGAFGATGQRCTAMSRAIVQNDVAEEFIELLLARTQEIKVGPGMREENFMGPCVSKSQMTSILDYIELGKQEGARLLFGGDQLQEGEFAKGYFLSPTIFDDVDPEMRIAQEEVFGPVLCIIRVRDFDAAIHAANAIRYGLTSVIYTRDLEYALRFAEEIEAGMAHVNSPWLGGEVHLPFGGTKESAIGPHEMGDETFEFFTQTKTVYINFDLS
jgi:acyl-CoA reductase-like NAD-dependent aldehyde dehydrogenase